MTLRSAIPCALPADPYDWLGRRGSDVRAFDEAAGREVFGPGHAFAESTDIVLTNGLIRFAVGAVGEPPGADVEVFASSMWRARGALLFVPDGAPDLLAGARLLKLTPDAGTVALSFWSQGPVFLSLYRGQRSIHVQHGHATTPSGLRYVRWTGVAGIPSALTDGRRTVPVDADGVTLGLGVASTASAATADFGVVTDPAAPSFDAVAFAVCDASDSVATAHGQFLAVTEQQLRVR